MLICVEMMNLCTNQGVDILSYSVYLLECAPVGDSLLLLYIMNSWSSHMAYMDTFCAYKIHNN